MTTGFDERVRDTIAKDAELDVIARMQRIADAQVLGYEE
jgi:hypothetical protein